VECRRYYQHHRHEIAVGDLVHARHILFQVVPGVNVVALRARAERALNELLGEPEGFAAMARELSNCPSGKHGGNLGQIGRGDTVPEFERALFRLGPTGILPEVVKTRYGLHVVAADTRILGNILPFEEAKGNASASASGRASKRERCGSISRFSQDERRSWGSTCSVRPRPSYNDLPACEGDCGRCPIEFWRGDAPCRQVGSDRPLSNVASVSPRSCTS
jgi:hypothetical protein